MSGAPDGWTTLADLRAKLLKRWQRGEFLAAEARGEEPFPLELRLRTPSSKELSSHFEQARGWIAEWSGQSHFRIGWKDIAPRLLGSNRIPDSANLASIEDLAALLNRKSELERFRLLVNATTSRQPALLSLLAGRPFDILDAAGDWAKLMTLTEWLAAHPRPGIYIRQLDIPGIDTKFVERRRQLLSEMLDLTLSSDAIDQSAKGASGFNRRFGFLDKPLRLRFRYLDPATSGFAPHGSDLTIACDRFSELNPDVDQVFITENEINFLSFPATPRALALFGSGYGFELASAQWLHTRRVRYWGDIDTHGFAILDQLRCHVPTAESLLMDHETLLAFPDLWGLEDSPTKRELPRLTLSESSLYNDLRSNRFADRLRLEQERVKLTWLVQQIGKS